MQQVQLRMKFHPDRRQRITALALAFLAALPGRAAGEGESVWHAVVPGVLQSAGYPCAYALLDGPHALLIGAPNGVRLPEGKRYGMERWALALLTHHHRDSCAGAAALAAAGVPVRAPRKSEALLSPEHVRAYWRAALPAVTPGRFPPLFERSWNRWSYLVHPTGIDGLRYDLEDGQTIAWRGWTVEVLATPGHSPDHLAFVARRSPRGAKPVLAFCGDALCRPGKVWSPYTTDWHHVQSDGLQAAAASLDRLAECKPDLLCPEHGPVIARDVSQALTKTAAGLRRAALLKSYERYTKETLGQPVRVAFLAPDQVGSANPQGNPRPWTKLSPHLYLTGNTYALASKDGPVLLVDPYSENLVQRLEELRRDHGAGPAEVVLVSHAHNDHYTGIFALPRREQFQVWTLDRIADVIGDPVKYRAPYVDARPVKTDRRLEAGQTVTWREYELKVHHQPGQTAFAMGVEVVVDGKRCLFTGDNFYHADQYSGSGGWSGLNRGLPGGYVQTTRQVMALRPDWVLAEHGGAFEYQAEDFRRRLRWAEEAAAAADALSPSGRHVVDWDPHRIRVEPVLVPAFPGRSARVHVVVASPAGDEQRYRLHFARPDIVRAPDLEVTVPPRSEARREVELSLSSRLSPGRYVVPCVAVQGDSEDGSDPFVILEVE
jgi:glyoxylase-like metal-dependent hydrolase (beta-lactamase superfamily II)